jgi:hypothetical protein
MFHVDRPNRHLQEIKRMPTDHMVRTPGRILSPDTEHALNGERDLKADPTDTFDEMIFRSGSALELTQHLLRIFARLQVFTDFAIRIEEGQTPDPRQRHLAKARQAVQTLQERILHIQYRYRRYQLDGLAKRMPNLATNWLREVSDTEAMLEKCKKIVEAGVRGLPLDQATVPEFFSWRPAEHWSVAQRERLWKALGEFRELGAVYFESRQHGQGRN